MRTLRLLTIAAAVLVAAWGAGYARNEFGMSLVAVDDRGGGDATISPDGRRFVTSSRRTGDWELWIFDIQTKAWSRITHDRGEDFEAKWSPDATRLVFTSARSGQKDIWTIDLRNGAQRQLTSSPDDDEYPIWSPDGRFIVYTGGPWNARDFFAIPAGGGAPRKITRTSGRAGACSFETDETLVCHRYDAGSGDLIRVWIDDGQVAPLTAGNAWDYKPAPSPDGKTIAFSRSLEGPSKIWMLPGGGGRPWPLTTGEGDDRWPTWSADSRRLLFHRAVDESLGVERLDRRGDRPPATLVPADEQPLQASLHPDGTRVAYCAATAAGRRVKVRDIGTGVTREVDASGSESCHPRWSPAGDRLALTVRTNDRWDIAVATAAGGALRVLTAGRSDLRGMDGSLDWSPDGRRLVFQADAEPFEARLYVIDVEANAIAAITSAGFFDESPSWSPDGKHIVFMSTRGGNWTWGLYQVALATGAIEPFIAPDWTEKNYPVTAGDGSRSWIAADASGIDRLIEQPPHGRPAPVRRARGGARWPSYSRDQSALIYTRVAHRVEFWVVDNPTGRGAPVRQTVASRYPPLQPAPARGGESPRAFHRR